MSYATRSCTHVARARVPHPPVSPLPPLPLAAGVTPLHIASWLGHHNTVQALLQAGADTEAVCLEVGSTQRSLRLPITCLWDAAHRRCLASLALHLRCTLSVTTPEPPPGRSQGRTALAIACYFVDCRPKKAMAVIQALLDAGANPLCADFHGIGSLVLRWGGSGWGGWRAWAQRAGSWLKGGCTAARLPSRSPAVQGPLHALCVPPRNLRVSLGRRTPRISCRVPPERPRRSP